MFVAFNGKARKMHFGEGIFCIAVALIRGYFKQPLRLRDILPGQLAIQIHLAQQILRKRVILMLGLP